jgi:hypothetical protein
MGKENTRTLKNVSYKKPSKKKSRKNSLSETEKEMRNILDSASEDFPPGVRNFLGGNNMQNQMSMGTGMPGMPMPGMPMPGMPMPGSGMPEMPMMPPMSMPMQGMSNQMQMFSPANYDPIMLQSIAPLQTRQAIAPPNGLMDPTSFAHSIASYSRQPGGMVGGGGMPFDNESVGSYGIPAGNLFRIV